LREYSYDVIILGAGAAGLMCAIEAGKRGRRVAVLERAERIGKKILISGGGRCNFTNLHCRPENFLSNNPHFCKSALARYTPQDFIALVEKHGIAYHEKKLGQLFCDRAAQDIVGMLETECRAAGVDIFTRVQISEVNRDTHYVVRTTETVFESEALVVATGGLSIPKIGATAFGYELATQFGLTIVPCRPALVPLVLNAEDRTSYCDLAGVSTEVFASVGSQVFREKMLITHRGLSGPAILQISSYWDGRQPITIDLAPDKKIAESLRNNTRRDIAAAKLALHQALPIRLAERWLDLHPPQRWTNADLDNMERQLHHWEVLPSGTEGYEKAEVTGGGVDTDELSAKTMEAKNVPGLFFIGEVVDVTGHLGGYNFQWAWASGLSAGQAV
jgi:predicted Rossmann fold flavoprotein